MKEMKTRIMTLIWLLLSACALAAQETWNPVADEAAVVQSGGMRFTVLTPQLIRIQYSRQQKFEDRATFAVVNRRLPVPDFTTREEDGYLYITTDALELRYRVGSVPSPSAKNTSSLTIRLNVAGRQVTWYPGKDNALNLKGTLRTLDQVTGDSNRGQLEDGILSRDGWAILDESPRTQRGDGSTTFAFDGQVNGFQWVAEPVDKAAYDWYFFGYGHEYKRALADFIKVCGRIPMPPLYIMGYWYSKYQQYTQQDFTDLVNEIQGHKIPIDVMIFDMDWHRSDQWTGWSWDKNKIPNPVGLISWMHRKNLKVSLNLHPADGVASWEDNFQKVRDDMQLDASVDRVPWTLEDSTFYKSVFERIIRLREKEGVDFWWLDWQQNLTNPRMKGLSETFWCNHVFYNDMKYARPERRPVIYHRWGGMGSHRYPIGFSGDTHPAFSTLAYEVYFTATASNVGFGYWGHDLGGHNYAPTKNNDPELYLRWMQFGVFTPIFRTHASNHPDLERRIWKYSNFQQLRETVLLRYELMPYIYTAARQAYDTGISICRPLYYEWPEENNAYRYEDEYYFGDDILVAPVVTAAGAGGLARRTVWLPRGTWYDVSRGRLVSGDVEQTDSYAQTEIPYFLRGGSILVCNPPMMHLKAVPESLILKVVPGADGETRYYEDEGDTDGYKQGLCATTRMAQQRTAGKILFTIEPRQGSFPGMIQERSYQVVFLAEQKPEGVSINGVPTDDWSYDEMAACVTVRVPKTRCDQEVKVEVARNTTAVNSKNADNVIDLFYDSRADEMVASMARKAKSVRLQVISADGKPAATGSTRSADRLTLSLAQLPQGAYVCRLVADGQTVTRKFIK